MPPNEHFLGMQDALFDEFREVQADGVTVAEVVYIPKGQAPIALDGGGIFHSAHRAIDLATNSVISTNRPTLKIKLRDIAPYRPTLNEDVVLVDETEWIVADSQENGMGLTTLILEAAPRFD